MEREREDFGQPGGATSPPGRGGRVAHTGAEAAPGRGAHGLNHGQPMWPTAWAVLSRAPSRYLKQLRKPHRGYVTFSIWSSLRAHYSKLRKEGIWPVGENSRLPTEDRLCKAGFQLASYCNVYSVSSESVDHLFLHCPLTAALWEAVFSVFQRQVSVDSWSAFFSQAMLVSFSDHEWVLWKAIIHAMVWSVWFVRNK
ncbi:hypothetical protein LWI29_008037 [Acer saccharum]|uniref:Reverse transcriptase zinc-binding domain-containing protein n=1 Tax=Acer saccharum TaxID=4024 RepID=A0AA39RVC8_ACESA|nr:hypothetical protein LWI29_008037 [Acer saccharum]